MRLSCPACGAHLSLDAALSDADARRFADLMATLPASLARPLIAYLALFRPAKTGLRWPRLLGLAQEIVPMIQAAEVRRHGRVLRAPHAVWEQALGQLADRPASLSLPLKTHGYLLEIVAQAAERAAQSAYSPAHRPVAGVHAGPRTPGELIAAGAVPARSPPPPDWRDALIDTTTTTKETTDGQKEA